MSESATDDGDSTRHAAVRTAKWAVPTVWFAFWVVVARVHVTQGAVLDAAFTGVWALAPLALVAAAASGVGVDVDLPDVTDARDAVPTPG